MKTSFVQSESVWLRLAVAGKRAAYYITEILIYGCIWAFGAGSRGQPPYLSPIFVFAR